MRQKTIFQFSVYYLIVVVCILHHVRNIVAASVILLKLEKPPTTNKNNNVEQSSGRSTLLHNKNSNKHSPAIENRVLLDSRILKIKKLGKEETFVNEVENSPAATDSVINDDSAKEASNVIVHSKNDDSAKEESNFVVDSNVDKAETDSSIGEVISKANEINEKIQEEVTAFDEKNNNNGVSSQEIPLMSLENIQILDQIKEIRIKPLLQSLLVLKFPGRNQVERYWQNNLSKQTPATRASLVGGAAAFLVVAKAVSSEPVRRCCYFWSRAGPIIMHYKFTKWWMRITNADREKRDLVYKKLHDKYSKPSLDIMLNLKGLYVKVGQILSSRPDFVPRQYVEMFSELQDSIPQLSLNKIESVVRRSLHAEWGLDYDEVFESMDPIALGSASIGQVHKATIRDVWAELHGHRGKKDVAVKVMHPGAKERFTCDYQVVRWLCRVALPGWMGFVKELQRQVLTEFDYRNEALSLHQVRQNMAKSSYGSKVLVPEPYEELCSKEVLVMELLHGRRLIDSIESQLGEALGGTERASEFLSLRRKEVIMGVPAGSNNILRSTNLYGKLRLLLLIKQCQDCLNLLVDLHGHQIFVDGCWNGDPHAGNFLQLDDGRIGLIDYGQTKRIHSDDRRALAKVVVALAGGSSPKEIAQAMRNAGFSTRYDDDDMMTTYAKLFFESDDESEKQGCATPQEFFSRLMATNSLVNIPDAAVFVARASFLLRGFGHAVGTSQIKTSQRWYNHAKKALEEGKAR